MDTWRHLLEDDFFLGGKCWGLQELMEDADWESRGNPSPKPGIHISLQVSFSKNGTFPDPTHCHHIPYLP